MNRRQQKKHYRSRMSRHIQGLLFCGRTSSTRAAVPPGLVIIDDPYIEDTRTPEEVRAMRNRTWDWFLQAQADGIPTNKVQVCTAGPFKMHNGNLVKGRI